MEKNTMYFISVAVIVAVFSLLSQLYAADEELVPETRAVSSTQPSGVVCVKGNTSKEIQTAINSLPKGGTVMLGAGVYTIYTSIVIPSRIQLIGTGAATILKLAKGANCPIIVIGDANNINPKASTIDVLVSNLQLDGNQTEQGSEYCLTTGKGYLRNNCITIRRGYNIIIDKVTVSNSASGGIVTEMGCRRVTLTNIVAFSNKYDGIACYETEDSNINNVYLYDHEFGAGLSFDIKFNNNIISNVSANDNKLGIFMRDSFHNQFDHMSIRRSREHGIFIAQVDNDVTKNATGNMFINCMISESEKAGIQINDASCLSNEFLFVNLYGNAECIHTPSIQPIGVICNN